MIAGHQAQINDLSVGAPLSVGQAMWNQRQTIADLRNQFKVLSGAVNRPGDLFLCQWAEIAAFALEFRPDIIVELGRGFGNSTCCFVEVAHRLSEVSKCRVVSLCRSNEWHKCTVPRLNNVVSPDWFRPLEIRVCDILETDVTELLGSAQRCLVLWDAHGFGVAEWVLATLLPGLIERPHVVLMHDLSDLRYDMSIPEYQDVEMWKGTNADAPSFCLGHIFSNVAQAISIVDFTSRNRVPLHSAAESLENEIGRDPAKRNTLKELLGDDFYSLRA